MTLDKAIEILEEHSHLVRARLNPDLKAAFELGIEALKEHARARGLRMPLRCGLLPGETEE